MVKMIGGFVFALLFLLWHATQLAAVQISAEIDGNQGLENQPLKGILSITHNKEEQVEIDSLTMENKPLKAEFTRDVRFSPTNPLILSMYRFELPGKSAGLYLLPELSVKVAGKVYRSGKSSYEVLANPYLKPEVPTPTAPQPAATAAATGAVKPVLRLEASIDGNKEIYPGQLTKLVYRYFYLGKIDLVTEKLPLLDAEGLRKIGEKEITDYTQGGLDVNQIVQVVEALHPGTFSYGPSLIEGYAYQEDAEGRHVRSSEKLVSEAPALVLTVLPFPEKERPASFNGAVGSFQFDAKLLSSPNLVVGSEFSLELTISGKGYMKSVPVPDLCCQPGFSGFFKTSDLPPVEEVKETEKRAVVKLQPLTSEIKEIPQIEFSFFDPDKKAYVVLHSHPIPVTVAPAQQPLSKGTPEKAPTKGPAEARQEAFKPTPIEIMGLQSLSSTDLHNKPFGSWWALGIIPFSLALLLFQFHLNQYLEKKRREAPPVRSEDLIQQAMAESGAPVRAVYTLGRALKWALAEKGVLPHGDLPTADLPDEGVAGEVKKFLDQIEEERFSAAGKFDFSAIQKEALTLYHQIKGVNQ